MARRRTDASGRPGPASATPPVPDRLRRWYLDDWVTPDDPTGDHATMLRNAGWHPDDPTARWLARAALSRARFRAARRAWADDLRAKGLTPPQLPRPGRPAYRHLGGTK